LIGGDPPVAGKVVDISKKYYLSLTLPPRGPKPRLPPAIEVSYLSMFSSKMSMASLKKIWFSGRILYFPLPGPESNTVRSKAELGIQAGPQQELGKQHNQLAAGSSQINLGCL
jgi:hypothetical protein